MIDNLHKIYAGLRKEKNLSQLELSRRFFQDFGVRITPQAISKWETGSSSPNAQQLMALCEILGISDLGIFTGKPDALFSGLNREGRQKVEEYAHTLRLSGLYADKTPSKRKSIVREAVHALRERELSGARQEAEDDPLVKFPVCEEPAAAGFKNYLTDVGFNMETFPRGIIPKSADYAIKIAGSSMEPGIMQGDIVFVREQPALDSGEVGIFMYNGNGLCKRYSAGSGGEVWLLSDNPDVPDIRIAPGDDDFRVVGKVIGVYREDGE